MQRIPEPELMEDEIQAQAYAEADFEEPHTRFIRVFQETWPHLEITGQVLDLGCGPADIAIRIAQAYPRCRIDGVDGSASMLRFGLKALRSKGLEERIHLIHEHLPTSNLPSLHYAAVISNSLLHHLQDPLVLWNTVRSCAMPQAPVFVMDLLRPSSQRQARVLVEEYAGGEPAILQRDFYNSLLAAYRVDEIRAQLQEAGLAHLSLRAISERHIAVSGNIP